MYIYTMGKTRYNRVSEMLKPIVGQKISRKMLMRHIMVHIGSTNALIRDTMKLMINLEMIHEIKQDVFTIISYEVDLG